MKIVANILVGIVAVLHIAFLVLEMFLWTGPYGAIRVLGETHDAANSQILAQNQGLYNGFLAAGLLWSLAVGPRGHSVKVFCLICAVVAGVFGAATIQRLTFLLVQSAPAAVALTFAWLATPRQSTLT
jgi:putative membrane protein